MKQGVDMSIVDLRSDTVTKPTPDMVEAMRKAEVGDDVYHEDPTVNRLQERAAEMMGKQAGLFVASGTMGNLAAVLAHCGRGDEVIVGNKAHTFLFEGGGISALGGVHSCQLPNQADGSITLADLEDAIRPDDAHYPVTRLICLENTHNRCGGTYQTPAYTRQVAELAARRGLKLHLDGARIFNAAVAQGVEAGELAGAVDSVTFCLSKGLCAPVGSVLCGSNEFIKRAHRVRKMLGGGMRQAGILAAAGLVALEKMTLRLAEDHARARKLADGLGALPGVQVTAPATNMVFLSIADSIPWSTQELSARLKERGVLAGVTGKRSFRLVLHYWIDDRDVETTVKAFKEALQK
jgi:threonine aldolase